MRVAGDEAVAVIDLLDHFARAMTFWFLHGRTGPKAAAEKAWRGPRQVLPATLPERGRRREAKTSARLRTMTLPAPAFARYTATFRPMPVADGKTTLPIPSEKSRWPLIFARQD